MKKIQIIITILSFILYGFTGSSQEVVSSAGEHFEVNNYQLSWTIGETVTETFSAGANILTQGFHQTGLETVSIFELEDIDITVNIAPNPTPDVIFLYINNSYI